MHITFLYTSTCTIVSPTLIMSIQFFSETTITVIAKKDKDPEKKYPHHQFAHVRYSDFHGFSIILAINYKYMHAY